MDLAFSSRIFLKWFSTMNTHSEPHNGLLILASLIASHACNPNPNEAGHTPANARDQILPDMPTSEIPSESAQANTARGKP
jgi:hypothetical protein